MTLAQAAERFQTTEATLSRIETGDNRPAADLEDRICEITKLSRDKIAEPRLRRQRRVRGDDPGEIKKEGVRA